MAREFFAREKVLCDNVFRVIRTRWCSTT